MLGLHSYFLFYVINSIHMYHDRLQCARTYTCKQAMTIRTERPCFPVQSSFSFPFFFPPFFSNVKHFNRLFRIICGRKEIETCNLVIGISQQLLTIVIVHCRFADFNLPLSSASQQHGFFRIIVYADMNHIFVFKFLSERVCYFSGAHT